MRSWLSWSSGKDSAWALDRVRQGGDFEVTALLTSVTSAHRRIAMHAVRESLLEMQAAAAGLPLVKVYIPSPCSNVIYEAAMADAMMRARGDGVRHIIFGDLFLEDIRAYREKQLAACDMAPIFPLWRKDTRALAEEMLGGGLSAFVTCIDPRRLGRPFAGRQFSQSFLQDLPAEVDPCGENGEFHTFANAGPMFEAPIGVIQGDIVERDGFLFADLLPAANTERSEGASFNHASGGVSL